MEAEKKKFDKLSVKKVANIFYKQEPMAQIAAVIKKLKKNKKTKPSELAEMYNEKCISLCDQIETNKIEIENYKTIIFGLQKTLVDKDKEIENLKLESIKEKEMISEGEEKLKNLSLSVQLPLENKINDDGGESREDIIQKLQNKVILLNKEKNEFNLRMLEIEDEWKEKVKEKDEKIKELMSKLENGNSINDNEPKNEIIEKKKTILMNDDVDMTGVEIPKQETEEHKLMNYNKILIENLFMTYLLEKSTNFGKTVQELVNNFDKYSNIFIRDNLKVNNIFSNVLYEFLYRSYRRADLDDFCMEIFDNNSISRSEEFKAKLLENEFYTKGYVNEYHLNELNKK